MSNERFTYELGSKESTIFGKILKGEIPCEFIYEDDVCVAFYDKYPQAPIHFLVIPRKPITRLSAADDEDEELLGHLLLVGNEIARRFQLLDGFRVVVNDGPNSFGGAQTVYHLHVHFMGGRQMVWPPG